MMNALLRATTNGFVPSLAKDPLRPWISIASHDLVASEDLVMRGNYTGGQMPKKRTLRDDA